MGRINLSSPELIEHVIAKTGERAGNEAVDGFHGGEQPRLERYPWFSGAGRHRNADSQTLVEPEPGREGAQQISAPVIDDAEVPAGKPCSRFAVLEAPEGILRAASQ
jgi:hypothetical protein